MESKLLDFMQNTEILDYCLSKAGAYIDYPFGFDYITVKIKSGAQSRIFAEIFALDNELKMTFSTDEITAQYLRSTYPQVVVKGWHCPPVQAKYKSTVAVNGVSNETLRRFVDTSYERAISKLK